MISVSCYYKISFKTELSVFLSLVFKGSDLMIFSGVSHCHTLEEGRKCYSLVFTCSSVTTSCLSLTLICKNSIFILLNQFNWESLTWDLLPCPSLNVLLSRHHLLNTLAISFCAPLPSITYFMEVYWLVLDLCLMEASVLLKPGLDCAQLRHALWKDAGVKCMRIFPTTISAPV